MSDFRTTLTAKLKGHQLPVIRQTAAQVISLLSSDSCDIKKVSDTILRDQAFTARILRTANSAFYQRQAEKITTISRAMTWPYTRSPSSSRIGSSSPEIC